MVLEQIHEACRNSGIFHIINHGISERLIEDAFQVSRNYFELPEEKKKESLKLGSGDRFSPVISTTFQHLAQGTEVLQRKLLRFNANPLEDYLDFLPTNPADYREKMGKYTIEVRILGIQLFGAIMESLNLGHETNLKRKFEKGTHMIVTNSYEQDPDSSSSVKTGAPMHRDHSIITILLQSSSGLQVLDMADGTWKSAPRIKGYLQVFVGDHLEVLSNGIFKSAFHRVITPSTTSTTRVSIASFHNFEMDEIVEPPAELIDEDFPKRFKGCSARELLNHIHIGSGERFIDTIRI